MSWHFKAVGRDKEKLKAVVREAQCKDPVNSPHSGMPVRVADHLCAEIDRVRIYSHAQMQMTLIVTSSGSFHEQGFNETAELTQAVTAD